MLEHLRNRTGKTAAALHRRFLTLFDRFTGPEGQLPILLVILMVPVGFVLLPVMILSLIGRFCLYWPRSRVKRWAMGVLIPINLYCGLYLVSVPICLVWARHVGKNICEMAKHGELSNVTMDNRPPGIVNLGPSSARKIRELQPLIAETCLAQVRMGAVDSNFYPGRYCIEIGGPPARGTTDGGLLLHYHPVWTPVAKLLNDSLAGNGQEHSLTAFTYLPSKDEEDHPQW